MFVFILLGFLSLPASLLAGDAVVPRSASGEAGQATFRTGVELVSVTLVVQDRRGRPVSDLTQQDFEVLEGGVRRPILDFNAGRAGPVSLAILVDGSGSMNLGSRLYAAHEAAGLLLAAFDGVLDEAAVFVFDSRLHALQPFTPDVARLSASLEAVRPFGATSLYDAIAATARQVSGDLRARRAIVVLTDGLDTSSRLAAPEVSAVASASDVPVYVLVVGSAPAGERDGGHVDLADLARWTGGEAFFVRTPAEASAAARALLQQLRHQYLIAFEPAGDRGWRPLEIRLRDRSLTVRARSWYLAPGGGAGVGPDVSEGFGGRLLRPSRTEFRTRPAQRGHTGG